MEAKPSILRRTAPKSSGCVGCDGQGEVTEFLRDLPEDIQAGGHYGASREKVTGGCLSARARLASLQSSTAGLQLGQGFRTLRLADSSY